MISFFSNDDNDNDGGNDDDDDDNDNDNNDDSNDNDTIYDIAAGASFPHFTFLSDVWDLQPDRKVSFLQNLRYSDIYDEKIESINTSSVSLDSLLENVRVEKYETKQGNSSLS